MMAGRNQHYIPRFLQRAFVIQSRRREIWYFGRDGIAERRPIKRTASENFFYSETRADGSATLDDAITRKESDLAVLLNEVRAASSGDAIPSPAAAAIVSHLTQRTAHVRAAFSEGVARMLDRAEDAFSRRDNIEALMGLDDGLPNERFRDLVMKEVAARPEIARLGIPTRVLERTAFLLAKESSGEMVASASALLGGLRPQSTELVRDSHNKALGDTIRTSEYEAMLQGFDWSVVSGPAAGAILPDCVSIGLGSENVAGNHLLIGLDKLQALLLAVSPERLLLGRRPGFALPSDFDYNLEAARLSHTFFLAPRNDEETARLHALIGQKLLPALAEAVESGFDDAFRERTTAESENEDSGADTFGFRPTSGGQYELSLDRCGDERTAARIQERVLLLVDEVAKAMPLERLDGITIGSDYPGLLKAVRRGWKNAPEPETVPPELGIGVAQTVTVKRSGIVKGRIVASSIVSDAQISEDSQHRAWGMHALVRQLAAVAQMEIVERCLPGTLLGSGPEGIDGWLYANVDGAPESYAASWMAAAFQDSAEVPPGLRDLLATAIDRFMTVVPRERLAYREHGDLEALLAVVLPETRRVLIVAADLLGHCTAAGVPPIVGNSVLGEALDRAELHDWFGVYGGHLARFHRRSGRWESFDEFLAFNIHVERLLLSVGMFAWEAPEGLRVEVPLGTDAEALLAGHRAR